MIRVAIALTLLAGAAAADATLPERAIDPGARAPACVRDARVLGRGIRCRGDHCDVARWVVDRVLADTSALAGCARIVPWIGDGRPQGFKLYAVRAGSLLARLGLRNGDGLRTVNGWELSTPDTALEVYSRVRFTNRIELALVREGRLRRLTYRIVDRIARRPAR